MTAVWPQYWLASKSDLVQLNHHEAEWMDEYDRAVVGWDDDGKVVVLGTDGGAVDAPEDQTLRRAWAWIVPALNDAYLKGYSDGAEDEFDRAGLAEP